jgi:hypothetical protein
MGQAFRNLVRFSRKIPVDNRMGLGIAVPGALMDHVISRQTARTVSRFARLCPQPQQYHHRSAGLLCPTAAFDEIQSNAGSHVTGRLAQCRDNLASWSWRIPIGVVAYAGAGWKRFYHVADQMKSRFLSNRS